MPVVVDLWAPWCGPCRTLGPILEKVTDATDGQVVLVKVNVDENPQIATAFRAQSIPAVYAVKGGQIVDGFIGAYPGGRRRREFVASLLPTEGEQEMARLLEAGDEASLRQALELEPGQPRPSLALAELLDRRRADGRGAGAAGPASRRRSRCGCSPRAPAWPRAGDDDRRRGRRRCAVGDDYDDKLDGPARRWCATTRPPARSSSTSSR